jgi:hypothetical protein
MARRRHSLRRLAALACAGLAPAARADVTLGVPATANLYRAGGNAPASPGTDPPSAEIGDAAAGLVLHFVFVVGTTDCDGAGATCAPQGPDGSVAGNRQGGPVGALSEIAYRGAGSLPLLGVLLGPSLPADAPGGLDFRYAEGFDELAPALGQVFWIGDGLTGTGSGDAQGFVVPPGATRLYLGYDDATFADDTGGLAVRVPEPSRALGDAAASGALAAAVSIGRSKGARRC